MKCGDELNLGRGSSNTKIQRMISAQEIHGTTPENCPGMTCFQGPSLSESPNNSDPSFWYTQLQHAFILYHQPASQETPIVQASSSVQHTKISLARSTVNRQRPTAQHPGKTQAVYMPLEKLHSASDKQSDQSSKKAEMRAASARKSSGSTDGPDRASAPPEHCARVEK